jgi:hypothetical protein
MDRQTPATVTVISLFDNNNVILTGILDNDLRQYMCVHIGLEPTQLDIELDALQAKGLIILEQATLH